MLDNWINLWFNEIEVQTFTFTSLGLHSWHLTVSPLTLSEKYLQARALVTLGMIVLLLVIARGRSASNWRVNVKHSWSSIIFIMLVQKDSFHFYFLLHLIKVLFANKSFITIVLSLFTQGNEWEGWTWPMMMRTVVVVTMIMMKIGENYVIWPANEAETKIPKNPGKISEKSRD